MEAFMKTTIVHTQTTLMSEDREILAIREHENYLIEPDAGMILKHKSTGQLYYSGLCVNQQHKIQQYEEIKDPRVKTLGS
jgi:hypothetical protein